MDRARLRPCARRAAARASRGSRREACLLLGNTHAMKSGRPYERRGVDRRADGYKRTGKEKSETRKRCEGRRGNRAQKRRTARCADPKPEPVAAGSGHGATKAQLIALRRAPDDGWATPPVRSRGVEKKGQAEHAATGNENCVPAASAERSTPTWKAEKNPKEDAKRGKKGGR